MTLKEAKALVIAQGYPDPDNTATLASEERCQLFVLLHSGVDPGRERMAELLTALKTIFAGLEGQMQLERKLTAALWLLGYESTNMLNHPESRANLFDEVFDIQMAIESIFFGEQHG